MLNIAIISRDHEQYYELYQQHLVQFTKAKLVTCAAKVTDAALNNANIFLAEPDVAADFIPNCHSIEWLQSTWAGNNILQSLPRHDYLLTGVKGIFEDQMSEYVMAYILYFQRRIAEFSGLQKQSSWQRLHCDTLRDKVLGIMGLGSIGVAVAKRAMAFGMKVKAITKNSENLSDADYYKLKDCCAFAKDCDYVLNLLPETNETIGICDKAFFENMKATAVFINAGRGSVIENDDVLLKALNRHQLHAAVLDVFKQEPLSTNSALYQQPRCFITNHSAAVSNCEDVFRVFVHNFTQFNKGATLRYIHDFSKGY